MTIELFVALVAGVCIPVFLAWTGRLQSRISSTEKDLSKFMVDAAKTYITKADLNNFESIIEKRFDRLETKIDNFLRANHK